MKYPNCVRQARLEKGFSRAELAQLAGISRQSIGLIEAGRVCPSTVIALRLSRILGRPVEELFWEPKTVVSVRLAGDMPENLSRPMRTYVGQVRGDLIARPCVGGSAEFVQHPVHGLVRERIDPQGWSKVELLQPYETLHKTLFLSGCDVGLGLLAQHVARVSRYHSGVWFNTSNEGAIRELESGITHVAAVHYPPEEQQRTHEGRLGPIRKYHFAMAELGWVLPRGNPKGFRGPEDLKSGHFQVVNREPGSGARDVLDSELKRVGIDPKGVPGYDRIVKGHFMVAQCVALGQADVGIAHAGAAEMYRLDFLPIRQETCTLLIPEEYLSTDAVQALLEVLNSDVFKTELASFGPYDVRQIGTMVS